MKIALAQINTTVAAVHKNTRKVIQWIDRARLEGADLVVFCEMTLTGYPPKDLFERSDFIEESDRAMQDIKRASQGIGVVVGFVERNPGEYGKDLYNSAALLADGECRSTHRKCLLPNYDVFDEMRYFEPDGHVRVDTFQEEILGISICEDIWNDKQYWRRRLYRRDPIQELVDKEARVLINLSASPYSLGKRRIKNSMLAGIAKRHQTPVIYVNQVGGNDHLVFDGASIVFDSNGEIVAQARDFEEDMILYDTETGRGPIRPLAACDEQEVYQALILGLRDYVRKCGFSKVVVGLSGGIDSALTATLAAHALGPSNVTGISMPSRYSSSGSKTDAQALAENLGIRYLVIPIEPAFRGFLDALNPVFRDAEPDVTEENIQARVRGTILMAYSNKFGSLVLSTGNKSELAVGYCTLYGDMSGGLAVISDVPKTLVYRLARWINRDREVIPVSTLEKAPSAELRPDQQDTDSLPAYEILDPILRGYIEENRTRDELIEIGNEPDIVDRVLRMVEQSEYKRQQAAPGIKVTSKAFGFGRRMPIARGTVPSNWPDSED